MTNLYTIDHSRVTGYLRNYDPIKQYFVCFLLLILHVHLLYLKNISYILTIFYCPAILPLKLWNFSLSSNISFLLQLMIKTNLTILLSLNNLIHILHYSSFLPKLPLIWYKLNKRLDASLLLLNTPHQFEMLLKNSNMFSIIVLSAKSIT